MNIMHLMNQTQPKTSLDSMKGHSNKPDQATSFLRFLSQGEQKAELIDDVTEDQLVQSLGEDFVWGEELGEIPLIINILGELQQEDASILKDLILSLADYVNENDLESLLIDIEINDLNLDGSDRAGEFSHLLTQTTPMLANIIHTLINEKTLENNEKLEKLLHLLKKFNELSDRTKDELYRYLDLEMEDKTLQTFQMLTKTFDKRSEMSMQQMYLTDASVSKADISKWLSQALHRYDFANTQSTYVISQHNGASVQMDALQQYEIYIRSTEKINEVSSQLLTKFTNIMQKSNFMQHNGLTQLQITMNPTQLGNITVRMMEIDGEMIVKLLVTSSATKKILESNVHQLKHIFSPHQIMVEKDPTISDEEFFHQEEETPHEDEEMSEEEQKHEEVQSEIDFEQLLRELGKEDEQDDED